MFVLYNLGVFLYWSFINTASLFHSKAKLWVRGRKDIFSRIDAELKKKKINGASNIIWFHCASLGEFEQGRPVIEKLKAENKEIKIVLTFFSPSGYEIRKDYELADAVFYLPIDFKSNVKKFLALVKPTTVVFVKYEFWLNYLTELKKQNIPTYLISAVFRKKQHFFKGYGKIFLDSLSTYKKIFVQDENSLALLQQHGIKNAEAAGDTRFDRVMQITKVKNQLPEIDRFCANSTVLIAGSTWLKDTDLVLNAYVKLKEKDPGLKLMLVPHEVDESSISQAEKMILEKDATLFFARYTSKQNFERHDILIIDTIGMLSQLYRFGTAAYVGGGFTDGIHSILEVMAHNVPVAFGPHNYKFVEAQEAKKLEIGREVHNEAQLLAFFSEMITPGKAKTLSVKISDYMRSKIGATEKICGEIKAS